MKHLTQLVALAAAVQVVGCGAPTLELPSSIAGEIRARTGVEPAWASAAAPTAQSLVDAAATPLPSPLGESDAVALALSASPEIARLLAETAALRAEALDDASPMNPTLELASAIPLGAMNAVPVLAMVATQIDELWKQPIRSEIARDAYEAALLSLASEAVLLSVEARARWHEIALREDEARLANEDATHLDRLLAMTRERFEAGEASQDDVTKAIRNSAQAHRARSTAQQMNTDTRLALMGLLGHAEAPVEWQLGLDDEASRHALGGELSDERVLVDQLSRSRLDVRAAVARAKAAKSRLTLATASRLRGVQVGAGWERDMEGADGVAFSAVIELPIFNTGSHRIAKAYAEWQAAEIAAETTRQQAITQVRQALAKASASQSQHQVAREGTLSPTASSLLRAKARHESGEGAAREVVEAQHEYSLAALELNMLERTRRQSRLELLKATGFLVAEIPQ